MQDIVGQPLALLQRDRERMRRARLQRQIDALERKLDKIGPHPVGLARDRAFKLVSKVKRLKGELLQPVLPW